MPSANVLPTAAPEYEATLNAKPLPSTLARLPVAGNQGDFNRS